MHDDLITEDNRNQQKKNMVLIKAIVIKRIWPVYEVLNSMHSNSSISINTSRDRSRKKCKRIGILLIFLTAIKS